MSGLTLALDMIRTTLVPVLYLKGTLGQQVNPGLDAACMYACIYIHVGKCIFTCIVHVCNTCIVCLHACLYEDGRNLHE